MLRTHFQAFSYGSKPGLLILLHICRVELALFLITTYDSCTAHGSDQHHGVLHCQLRRDACAICHSQVA